VVEMKNVNEERTTAASYVLNFYQQVEQLTHFSVLYINLILDLETRYKNLEESGIAQEEKDQLKNLLEQVKYYAQITSLKYGAIESKISTKKAGYKSKIMASVKGLFGSYVLKRESVYNYTELLNAALAENVMSKLLETSQELAGAAYD
jgi:hypothetical protein